MWRIRINQKLGELYENLDMVADIKKKRFEWMGHVARMDQGRTVKEVFESKAEGSRRRVRPRLRWMEDVEKDLRETKVKRWRQKAVDRKEWASIITEAKALRGPYRRGVSSSRAPSDIVDIERTRCVHTHRGEYGV